MSIRNDTAAVKTLEFSSVLGRLAELVRSVPAHDAVSRLQPFDDRDSLEAELSRITEMRELLDFDDPFPFEGFDDLRPALKRAETGGVFLDGAVFMQLLYLLRMTRLVREYFSARQDKYPLLQACADPITPLQTLEKAIVRIVDDDGTVRDKASDTLYAIRRDMLRIESAISRRLQAILKRLLDSGAAPEETLSVRQGRPVIPVLESRRSKVRGVLVDQSASGTTLYIEPLEIVEMRNDLARLQQQEQREIERLLRQLTDELRDDLAQVSLNLETAVRFDIIIAKAGLAAELRGLPAHTAPSGRMIIKNGRHPLLIMRMGYEKVVPLDLRLGEGYRTLIITGPNAGGKTVALKTAGILSLMHAWGLHVPAGPGTELPLFTAVFADIGDRQSIEQDLSTFSSHISNIRMILASAGSGSLVLLDEIGSATDPDEGAALAEVMLKELTAAGALTMATTHIGALKVFAHETGGVENGSMVFDQETLSPTYRFQAGIPGSSYAFEIAERLGIEKRLIRSARDMLGEDRGHVSRLIRHLEDELARARELKLEADLKESELSGLVNLYRERAERLKTQSAAEKERLLQDAETLLAETNVMAERIVKEIRETQAGRETIRKAKEQLERQRQKLAALKTPGPEQEESPLQPGDWVTWPGQGGKGRVLTVADKSGRVQVQWGDVKIRIPASDVKKAKKPQKKSRTAYTGSVDLERRVRDEIDVRGMTGIEAAEAVEKYLGDARMTGYSTVRIIHGKGTGVLRREISRLLKGHPLVASQRLGNWNEGDTGVTIVELAS
ncbi:endonuclease MutS2 [bacterium]|nr:endonuclease MutS2 [bacterium]